MIFYECAVRGVSNGQDIVNVLYYVDDVALQPGWDPATALALGEAVASAWETNALPHLPTVYNGQEVTVRAINERREVISSFSQIAPITGNGALAVDTETPGMVGIIGFQVLPLGNGNISRVPRRSYIAFGPIVQSWPNSGGTVSWPPQAVTALTALLTQGHLIGAQEFDACRVGTPNAAGVPAAGGVVGVLFRDFASFRRSRLIPPSGERG